ncbi:hypothetical protein [Streptomyces capillispiralis]|uniref:Uncharacterized protein n=1 Tax=Streptomyces capillispiralis TaxID=68182 RepID=A0A561TI38_9ACTN|nr:hypothetical protein [Streptomyces capillispiralis]TWF86785.1 hypothetical protein FHX78_113776 [Streptomyces capillispiralis]GHH90807.1 hypothetical protein GCM10017779_12640 [Streptomyces capillispiralis]
MRSAFRAVAGCLTAVALALALTLALAPAATALPLPLPLPVPAGAEPLVTEGVTVEGPLVNNLTLPSLR